MLAKLISHTKFSKYLVKRVTRAVHVSSKILGFFNISQNGKPQTFVRSFRIIQKHNKHNLKNYLPSSLPFLITFPVNLTMLTESAICINCYVKYLLAQYIFTTAKITVTKNYHQITVSLLHVYVLQIISILTES